MERLDLVSSELAFALAGGELLRSTDGGNSWAPILQPPGGAALSVDFWSAQAGIAETTGPYYVTYDGGSRWSALSLPSGWTAGPMNGDGSPGAFCFSGAGTGWAAVSRHGQLAVLVSTDGGRHWGVAQPPQGLPSASPRRYQGNELPGAGATIAGCRGQEAWVLVTQPVGLGNMQGPPPTFDLLVTDALGRGWEDVLQAVGSNIVSRPRVPPPPGGPTQANQGFTYSSPQSATSPGAGALWLTSYNGNFGGEGFASTGDSGQKWAQSYVPGQVPRSGGTLPSYGWVSTAAASGTEGWALFSGSVPKDGPQTSVLYVTHDAGATWARATTFPSSY